MSTNKTSLGLNQWEKTDKIQMDDFNRDNQIINAQLANKANGRWSIITSLEELGLSPGSETIKLIVDNMPNRSELYLNIHSGFNKPEYPFEFGTLHVTRYELGRSYLEFTASQTSPKWMGTRYLNVDGTTDYWSGWKQIVDKFESYPISLATKFSTNSGSSNQLEFDRVNSVVTLNLYAIANSDIVNYDTVANLPVGFRGTTSQVCALYSSLGTPLTYAILYTGGTQEVKIHSLGNGTFPADCKSIRGRMSFKAYG